MNSEKPGRPSPGRDLDRPYYQASEGKALLWYCIFGDFPEKPVLAAREAEGLPEGFGCWRIPRDAAAFSAFLEDYFGTLLDADPGLSDAVRNAPEMLRISGEIRDQPDLGYLAAVIGTVNAIGNHGAGILDPQTLTWWTREDWLATFQPFAFHSHAHVVILKSAESGGTHWLHTRGMRKFARPDIGIAGVPGEREGQALEILNRFIDFQALGGVVKDGQAVKMRDIPAGMVCRVGGDLDDPDFNNFHIAIRWPAGAS